MIKQCTVRWNGVLLNPQTDTYSLISYLAMVFNYTAEEGGSLLDPEGWWQTEPTTGFVPIDAPAQLTAINIDNTTPHDHYNALSNEQKAFVLAS